MGASRMTVHETIKQMMVEYPSLFPSRVQALHHLFWVNGNGYDWKKGELISIDPPHKTSPYRTVEWKKNHHEEWSRSAAHRETYEKLFGKEEAALADLSKFVIGNDNFVESYKIDLDEVYPLCEYADILNVPENVKDDWLEAAAEAIDHVEFACMTNNKKEAAERKRWVKQARDYLSGVKKNG
jgi:hypothetical protein